MVVKPESAIGAKGAIQTMKQTVDTLKAAGWTGYTKGKNNGECISGAAVYWTVWRGY